MGAVLEVLDHLPAFAGPSGGDWCRVLSGRCGTDMWAQATGLWPAVMQEDCHTCCRW